MSNYTLISPIDIKSSSTTGTINVYNPSGSNYVSIVAPSSLSTNVDFTLPSTTGETGQYLQRTGPNSLGWSTLPGGSNYILPISSIILPTAIPGFTYIQTTSGTFVNATYFIFPGTTAIGSDTPSFIFIGGSNGINTFHQIRILDITNSTTIVTSPTLGPGSGLIIYNVGTLNNLSTSSAVWQIQMRRVSGASNTRFHSFYIST
jgi:hypothetical protein